jgi:hypothetical protein
MWLINAYLMKREIAALPTTHHSPPPALPSRRSATGSNINKIEEIELRISSIHTSLSQADV